MDDRTTTVLSRVKVVQWSRRTTLFAIAALASSRTFPSLALAQAFSPDTQDPVPFEWEMPRRYGRAAAEYLGLGPESIKRSPNDEGSRGGPLLVVVGGIMGLVWLARAIVRLRRELRYGGIIIEDDGRRLSIRNDPRLPGNVIIIKDKNGVTVRELRGDVSPDEIIRALPRNAARAKGS